MQPQPQMESQPDLTASSVSPNMSAKPESETKSESEPALLPSSNSDRLTQPPQPQVMATPDKEEPPTVTNITPATNEKSDTHNSTKASSTTSVRSGSFCSCC
jgi:hypothetical protein